jgi:predicted dehydrogenase
VSQKSEGGKIIIRFGVIGTNWITEKFIEAASEVEDFKLTAVYSRTEERAKEFAIKFDVKLTFTDLHELAKNDNIDAVYIASPNSLHAEQAILFMNHGKHVLCEKPIASNSRELQNMIDTARKNNVLLMEALKTTVLPNFKSVQDNLHKIGKIRRFFSSLCRYTYEYDAYKNGTILNTFKPSFSNGSLMDIGVYCIYPMVVLFGKPQHVWADGLFLDSGVDGEGSLLLKYEQMDAVIMHSKITNSYVPSEIQGENGNIIMDTINRMEKVEIRYNDGTVEDITRPQSPITMYYEVKEFIELIKAGKLESQSNAHSHSLTTIGIMDEARIIMGLVFPSDQVPY